MLGIFNTDPVVAEFGMIRLRYIVGAHLFSVFVETISGALRGYGYSMPPALMALFGICGLRIVWVNTLFKANPAFDVLMMVYPVSIGVTAFAIVCAYFWLRRTKLKAFLAG
jgi:Na+-driven multidrug efflux pump